MQSFNQLAVTLFKKKVMRGAVDPQTVESYRNHDENI